MIGEAYCEWELQQPEAVVIQKLVMSQMHSKLQCHHTSN